MKLFPLIIPQFVQLGLTSYLMQLESSTKSMNLRLRLPCYVKWVPRPATESDLFHGNNGYAAVRAP